MQIFKKLLVFACSLVVIGLFFMLTPKGTLAASYAQQTDLEQCLSTVAYKDIAHVTCVVGGTTYTFTDNNPTDSIHNFAPPSGLFCGKDSQSTRPEGFNLFYDSTQNGWFATLDEGYVVQNQQGCKSFGSALSSSGKPFDHSVANASPAKLRTVLQGTSQGAQSLPGVTQGVLANVNFSRWDTQYDPSGKYLFAQNINLNNQSGGSCSGEILAVTALNGSSVSTSEYTLGGSGDPFSKYSDLSNLPNSPSCYVSSTNFGLGAQAIYVDPPITNIASISPGNVTGSAANTPVTQTSDSCVGASSSAGGSNLNWIICPVVAGISTTANAINDFVQGQLNVNVKENFGKPQIQTAWTVFKDIVSALLVIVMLVMVISQAVGGGGMFDAYTVKKMLPKLVIAIIGMQISWYVCIWLVGLFNDVGQGIGDLIAAPFGGQSALDLPSLLQNLNPAYAVIVGSPAGIGLGTLLGGIGVYLFWPTLLLGAFLALMAVIAALATLLVRNIILILAIIVAPLALIAWTLPGTQKFWKDWYGNFTKALMLFPIVMVVIIGGRIFAWIAANRGGAPGPLDLIMIFVGYLGPYFFLPKTFKYGGSLLAQASQGINKAKDSINKKPREFFQNRQKGWSTELKRRSQERYAGKKDYVTWADNRRKARQETNPYKRFLKTIKPGSKWYQSPLDKFSSGEWDPTLGGKDNRRKFEATAGYSAAGRESAGKTFEMAKNASQQIFDIAQDHDYVVRAMTRGKKFDFLDKAGRWRTFDPRNNPYWRAAGAAGIGKYGTDGSWRVFQAEIDRLRADGGDHALLAEEILDDMVGTAKPKMDSMYRGFRRDRYQDYLSQHPNDFQGAIRAARLPSIISSVDSMKDEWFGTMEGVEAQTLLAGLSHGIANGDEAAAERMKTLWQHYMNAASNPQLRGSIAPGVHKAFKAYAEGNYGSNSGGNINSINTSRQEEIFDGQKADEVDEETGRVLARHGEEDPATGVVIGREQRRDNVVLDTIVRDDPRNQEIIREVDAVDFMKNFNADGARREETSPLRTTSTASAASASSSSGISPTFGGRRDAFPGETTYMPIRDASAAAPPVEFRVDHEALGNTIAGAMKRGAENIREAAYEGTYQAHRRAGLVDHRGAPQTPRPSGPNPESTRPPEGPEGQNFDAF